MSGVFSPDSDEFDILANDLVEAIETVRRRHILEMPLVLNVPALGEGYYCLLRLLNRGGNIVIETDDDDGGNIPDIVHLLITEFGSEYACRLTGCSPLLHMTVHRA